MDRQFLDTLLQNIGAHLTDLRKQKGYSSHESFAFEYDLSRVQYWRLERGKSNFTIKTLAKVLAIHQLTVADFFAIMQAKKNSNETKLTPVPSR